MMFAPAGGASSSASAGTAMTPANSKPAAMMTIPKNGAILDDRIAITPSTQYLVVHTSCSSYTSLVGGDCPLIGCCQPPLESCCESPGRFSLSGSGVSSEIGTSLSGCRIAKGAAAVMRPVLLVATIQTSLWLSRTLFSGIVMSTLNRPNRSLLTRARTGGCSAESAPAATIVRVIRSRGIQFVPVTMAVVPM